MIGVTTIHPRKVLLASDPIRRPDPTSTLARVFLIEEMSAGCPIYTVASFLLIRSRWVCCWGMEFEDRLSAESEYWHKVRSMMAPERTVA